LLPAAGFLALVAWYLSASPFARTDFPLDDAWIHRVYARAFALGHGFAYNSGQQEAGATSPLWILVSAPAHWLASWGTNAVVLGVKALGVLLALACLWLVQKITRQLTESVACGAAVAALYALEPRLVFSSLSGMETVLVVGLALAATSALLARRWILGSLLIGLLPLARPESALALPMLFVFLISLRSAERPRRLWRAAGLSLIPSAFWVGFCLAVTGHPLPTTYYLKARSFQLSSQTLLTAWRALAEQGFGSTPELLVGCLAGAALLCRRADRAAVVTLGAGAAFPTLYAVAVVGGRKMTSGAYYFTRWLDPAFLLLTAFACVGLGLLVRWAFGVLVQSRIHRMQKVRSFAALGSLLVVALGAAIGLRPFAASLEWSRHHLGSDSRAIRLLNVQAGLWIREHVPESATLAVNDAGAIRYFGERKTLDLLGLNYARLAFGEVERREVFGEADWIAVFPDWFPREELAFRFVRRQSFAIPLEEYTICNCPGQTHLWIMERRGGPVRG